VGEGRAGIKKRVERGKFEDGRREKNSECNMKNIKLNCMQPEKNRQTWFLVNKI
jgi:hypothetical protein